MVDSTPLILYIIQRIALLVSVMLICWIPWMNRVRSIPHLGGKLVFYLESYKSGMARSLGPSNFTVERGAFVLLLGTLIGIITVMTPSWQVGKAGRNYSVGIQWQIKLSFTKNWILDNFWIVKLRYLLAEFEGCSGARKHSVTVFISHIFVLSFSPRTASTHCTGT